MIVAFILYCGSSIIQPVRVHTEFLSGKHNRIALKRDHMNNPLSYSSLKLELFSKDGVRLKPASGFMVEAGSQYYLITNWHVLSGSNNPASGQPEPVYEPFTLKTSLHIHEARIAEAIHRQRITIQLYDDNQAPRWIERQANGHDQPVVDVVALPIQSKLMNMDKLLRTIGEMPGENIGLKVSAMEVSAIDTDVEYGPPDTVYVIGYPLSWAPAGIDKSSAAFWRTASIASEIHERGRTYANAFFIDPSAPEGMTGSPVVGMKNGRTKLLGVYSDSATAEFGAPAGLVWDALLVKELIVAS